MDLIVQTPCYILYLYHAPATFIVCYHDWIIADETFASMNLWLSKKSSSSEEESSEEESEEEDEEEKEKEDKEDKKAAAKKKVNQILSLLHHISIFFKRKAFHPVKKLRCSNLTILQWGLFFCMLSVEVD